MQAQKRLHHKVREWRNTMQLLVEVVLIRCVLQRRVAMTKKIAEHSKHQTEKLVQVPCVANRINKSTATAVEQKGKAMRWNTDKYRSLNAAIGSMNEARVGDLGFPQPDAKATLRDTLHEKIRREIEAHLRSALTATDRLLAPAMFTAGNVKHKDLQTTTTELRRRIVKALTTVKGHWEL
jgi:hypothetical protein